MRWLAAGALGLAVASVAVGSSAATGPKLSCRGATCTLTITNTSGKDLSGLAGIAPAGKKFSKVTDAKATPSTVDAGGGKLVTLPAGECAVFPGPPAQFSCAYGNPNAPQWKAGESRSVEIVLDKPLGATDRIATCGQAAGATSMCADVGPGATSSTTTTTGATPARPDIDLDIKAPDVVVPRGKALFKISAVVTAQNIGTKVAHGTLEIRFKDADGAAVRELAHGAGCTEPATGYLHCGIALVPRAKKSFAVSVLQKSADWAPSGVGQVNVEYITHDRDDPVANNQEEHDVAVKVRG